MAVRLCSSSLGRRVIFSYRTSTVSDGFSYNPTARISNPSSIFARFPTPFYFQRNFTSSSPEGNNFQEESNRKEEGKPASSNSEGYSKEEKELEAASIGYKVLGPVQPSDLVFKSYKPVFAVVQIGSHQFKVSSKDSIFVEKLKFCEVNDKIILNKVLLLGSASRTIVGRPTIPNAAVHAVVEEHAMDAKVIIFKKKRRKNYRRTKGHRQELTQLKITDIKGIPKPKLVTPIASKTPPADCAQKAAAV